MLEFLNFEEALIVAENLGWLLCSTLLAVATALLLGVGRGRRARPARALAVGTGRAAAAGGVRAGWYALDVEGTSRLVVAAIPVPAGALGSVLWPSPVPRFMATQALRAPVGLLLDLAAATDSLERKFAVPMDPPDATVGFFCRRCPLIPPSARDRALA